MSDTPKHLSGKVEVDDLSLVMTKHDEDVQDTKRNCGMGIPLLDPIAEQAQGITKAT